MKNYNILVFEYSREETKAIADLVNLSLIGNMYMYSQKQVKIINRLVGGDRKWFDYEIEEIKEIIKVKLQAISESEEEVLSTPCETLQAKSTAAHIIDNYKVVRRDIQKLLDTLLTVDPNHDQNEADES